MQVHYTVAVQSKNAQGCRGCDLRYTVATWVHATAVTRKGLNRERKAPDARIFHVPAQHSHPTPRTCSRHFPCSISSQLSILGSFPTLLTCSLTSPHSSSLTGDDRKRQNLRWGERVPAANSVPMTPDSQLFCFQVYSLHGTWEISD